MQGDQQQVTVDADFIRVLRRNVLLNLTAKSQRLTMCSQLYHWRSRAESGKLKGLFNQLWYWTVVIVGQLHTGEIPWKRDLKGSWIPKQIPHHAMVSWTHPSIQTIVPSMMIVTKHCSVLETYNPFWHGSNKKQKPEGPTENLAELVAS